MAAVDGALRPGGWHGPIRSSAWAGDGDVAVLLGAVAGTSLGLVEGAERSPTAAALAVAPSRPASSPAAPRAVASAPQAGGSASVDQRSNAQRRPPNHGVKAAKAGKWEQKAPGDRGKSKPGKDREVHRR
jgi:hypothetical protein